MIFTGFEKNFNLSEKSSGFQHPHNQLRLGYLDYTKAVGKRKSKAKKFSFQPPLRQSKTMTKLTLKDLNLKNQGVLMRVDFNVPLTDKGDIKDSTRIIETLPSIQYVLEQEGKLILISHLGRPKGKRNPKFSLKPVRSLLEKLLNNPVKMADDCIGNKVEKKVKELKPKEILLLENVRFHEGEEHPDKDPSFVAKLAKLGDLYVNDAFGTAHRLQSSTMLLARFFTDKSAMGFLIEKELGYLSQLIEHPKRPFYAILGGSKIDTKIGVLKSLIEKVDAFFIGGGMVFTLLKAQNIPIGDSIFDAKHLPIAQDFLKECKKRQVPLFLPKDFIIAKHLSNEAPFKEVATEKGILPEWKGYDIGSKTLKHWSFYLKKGATIFWNGPMGVFEIPLFAKGTQELAKLLAKLKAEVIVGGGDSVAAIKECHMEKAFTHLSTGGGALLEYLELGHLPGIDVLTDQKK